MIEIKEFKRANAKQDTLHDLIHSQAMNAIEYFGCPIALILGKEVALDCYGNIDAKEFRVEGFQIPIKYIEGDLVYLLAEGCKLI